jgi:glycine betaine transporter
MSLTEGRPGWVFYISALILCLFVLGGALRPAELAAGASQALDFTTLHFGWLYLVITTGFLIFCVGVALSRYGNICPGWA